MKATKNYNELAETIMKIEEEVVNIMIFDNYNLDGLKFYVRDQFHEYGISNDYRMRNDDVLNIIYGAQNKIYRMGL